LSIHLKRSIDDLKKKILGLSGVVEEKVWLAVRSVEHRDAQMARQVIEGDLEIDLAEVSVEEDCLKILALHQPVAADLRFIVASLKINNDLERIGDLAVNIAERAAYLAEQPNPEILFDFPGMAAKGQLMLKKSLDALMSMNAQLAREVRRDDDEVDAINRQIYNEVKDEIRSHPERIDSLIHLLGISRHIERIADLATNIAEDVIYMVEGEIIRHRAEDYSDQASPKG
jgi:phosphate transport system protein